MNYSLLYSEQALEDAEWFKKHATPAAIAKIARLLEELESHPETGTGKPEQLRYQLAGCMSRRISREHRLLYIIDEDHKEIRVLSFRGHY